MSPELSAYISQYGSTAIFVLVFLQEIGVPNPVANELVLLFAGYLTSIGTLDFLTVLITVIAADISGTFLLYIVFYYGGQAVLQKWPHFISTTRLASLTARLARQSFWSIYLGRLIPFLRGYTSVAAGVLHISPGRFFPPVLLSALTWSGGYVSAGRLLGHQYAHLVSRLALGKEVLGGLIGALTLVCLGLWMRRWLHRKKTRTS